MACLIPLRCGSMMVHGTPPRPCLGSSKCLTALWCQNARGLRQSILSELKDITYSGQFGVTNSQQPHGHQIGGPPVGAKSVRLLQVVSMCGQRTRSPLACCNHHKCQPGAGPASARTSSPSYHATRSGHDVMAVVFVDRLSIALRPPPQLMMLKAQPSSSLRACTALMACLQRLSLTGASVSLQPSIWSYASACSPYRQ